MNKNRVPVPPQGIDLHDTPPLTSQVEDGSYMLTTSTGKTSDWLEPEGWWLRFLKHYPCYLTTRIKSCPLQPSPQMLLLKAFPWKSSGNVGLLSKSHLYSLLTACNKCCTSVNWLCYMVGEQTQTWFGNSSPSWITACRVSIKYKFLIQCPLQPT